VADPSQLHQLRPRQRRGEGPAGRGGRQPVALRGDDERGRGDRRGALGERSVAVAGGEIARQHAGRAAGQNPPRELVHRDAGRAAGLARREATGQDLLDRALGSGVGVGEQAGVDRHPLARRDRGDAGHPFGAAARQLQRHQGPHGMAHHHRPRHAEAVEQGREPCRVTLDARRRRAGAGQARARSAVARQGGGDDRGLAVGERRQLAGPEHRRQTGAVDQHQGAPRRARGGSAGGGEDGAIVDLKAHGSSLVDPPATRRPRLRPATAPRNLASVAAKQGARACSVS